MYGPKDEGLKFPLEGKMYHGRTVICDGHGNELFIMEVVRPSRESREMLKEWMDAICEKFNAGLNLGTVKTISVENDKLVISDPVPVVPALPVKRKRGRPFGSKKKVNKKYG